MPSSSFFLRSSTTLVSVLSLFSTPTVAAPSQLKPRQVGPQSWNLDKDFFSGANFFDNFNFFAGADPTHGFVHYVTKGDAQTAGKYNSNPLISGGGSGQSARMDVDYTKRYDGSVNYYNQYGEGIGRPSVRIESQYKMNAGSLIIADIAHMPDSVCGSWPAFWALGDDPWPNNGEVDIIEGWNLQSNNFVSAHTNSQCTLRPSNAFSGTIEAADCDTYYPNGQYNNDPNTINYTGCKVNSADSTASVSFGTNFNNNGGGIYAMKWTNDQVAVYFWTRSEVPADVLSNDPKPDTWTKKPIAIMGGPSCNPRNNFANMRIIFDTTFCGDAAGNDGAWSTCKSRLSGNPTCSNYVGQNPGAFRNSYWDVKGMKIYKLGNKPVTTTTTTTTTTKATTTTSTTTTTTTTKATTTTTTTSKPTTTTTTTTSKPATSTTTTTTTSSGVSTTTTKGETTTTTGSSTTTKGETTTTGSTTKAETTTTTGSTTKAETTTTTGSTTKAETTTTTGSTTKAETTTTTGSTTKGETTTTTGKGETTTTGSTSVAETTTTTGKASSTTSVGTTTGSTTKATTTKSSGATTTSVENQWGQWSSTPAVTSKTTTTKPADDATWSTWATTTAKPVTQGGAFYGSSWSEWTVTTGSESTTCSQPKPSTTSSCSTYHLETPGHPVTSTCSSAVVTPTPICWVCDKDDVTSPVGSATWENWSEPSSTPAVATSTWATWSGDNNGGKGGIPTLVVTVSPSAGQTWSSWNADPTSTGPAPTWSSWNGNGNGNGNGKPAQPASASSTWASWNSQSTPVQAASQTWADWNAAGTGAPSKPVAAASSSATSWATWAPGADATGPKSPVATYAGGAGKTSAGVVGVMIGAVVAGAMLL